MRVIENRTMGRYLEKSSTDFFKYTFLGMVPNNIQSRHILINEVWIFRLKNQPWNELYSKNFIQPKVMMKNGPQCKHFNSRSIL